jgi:hypothetical protein
MKRIIFGLLSVALLAIGLEKLSANFDPLSNDIAKAPQQFVADGSAPDCGMPCGRLVEPNQPEQPVQDKNSRLS